MIDSRYLEQGLIRAGIVERKDLAKLKELINKIKGGPPRPLFPNLANAKQIPSETSAT